MSNQQSTVDFGLRAVQFSRLTRRGILLGLSLPQLIVLATGVLSIVGALYAGGGILLAWTAPVWLLCAALAWTPVGGRKLIEWVPVTFRWVARTQKHQTVFRRRVVKPRPAGTLALPGDAAALREWEDPETGAAIIDDGVTAEVPDSPRPASTLEQHERSNRMALKIRGLKPEHRAVLVLRDLEGLAYDDIARITETPIGSVKGRLHRARKELIEALRNNTYDWELPR